MAKYITDIYSDKVFHWLMFLKHNNLGFLRKESLNIAPHKVEQDESKESVESYHEINDQIIQEFGMEESFLAHKQLQEEIALLKLGFIINGNKMNRTFWRIKEMEIKSPEDSEQSMSDLSKEIAIISKHIGVGIIDIKEYSIFQYLTAKTSTR